MKIPLQINGRVVGEIEETLSDDEIMSLLARKLVRVPGKLINFSVYFTLNPPERYRLERWTDEKGDHTEMRTL